MRFGDLKKQSVEDLIGNPAGNAPWFFVHIPKTAGSSFSNELRSVLPPYRNVHIDYSVTGVVHDVMLRECVDQFIASPDIKTVRSASGHIPLPLARRIRQARPEFQMVTMLRAPVARVLSDYRYQRTEMHPPHEEFRRRFPTLGSYVEHPSSHNKMARFIAGPSADRDTLLKTIEDEFAFVGLLEMYPFSFTTFFELAGKPGLFPREHLRRTPRAPETEVELTSDLKDQIRQTNALDVALYQHVRQILLPHRNAWVERRKAKQKQ